MDDQKISEEELKAKKRKETLKKYRETHKEKLNKYNRYYREIHKEERKEYLKKYRKIHREDENERSTIRMYSRKNEFHGLDITMALHSYFKGYRGHKMSKYFSSLENYISFSLNSDVSLKKSLIRQMYLGYISEQDALDAAGVSLTKEDLEYISNRYMRSKYSKEQQ